MTKERKEGRAGILSASELRTRLADPADPFWITPLIDPELQISDASVDLRLGRSFLTFKRTDLKAIDPALAITRETILRYQGVSRLPFGRGYVLHPNELVIASTIEYLAFPPDLKAYVVGRSSWGRLGLIIATATAVQPNFRGTLTLEMVNTGNVPIVVYPGARIAQLVFETLTSPEPLTDQGKYRFQIGPTFSKVYEDPEMGFLGRARSRPEITKARGASDAAASPGPET